MDDAALVAAIARLEKKLDAQTAQLAALSTHLGLGGGGRASASNGAFQGWGGGRVASDQDLDGQYGDPLIKKDPPRWDGGPVAPCHMSEAPPEWLENLANFLDWRAAQQDEKQEVDNKGRPRSDWSRKDAARARGWARRISANGGAPPPRKASAADQSYANDDDIPF
jgi:hypothetical protein